MMYPRSKSVSMHCINSAMVPGRGWAGPSAATSGMSFLEMQLPFSSLLARTALVCTQASEPFSQGLKMRVLLCDSLFHLFDMTRAFTG